MMKQICIRLDPAMIAALQLMAEQNDKTFTEFIREKLQTVIDKPVATKCDSAAIDTNKWDKIQFKMQLQILGLVRFLVGQVDESVVQEAIRKSEAIVADEFS